MSAPQSQQAPPSPPPDEFPLITSVNQCREAHRLGQTHLLAAVNLLSTAPPLPVDPVTRAGIASSSAGTLKNSLSDRLPKLIDGYNVLLQATSSLTKGLVQSQGALEYLLDSQVEDDAPGPSQKRARTGTGRASGSPEKGQRDRELTALVRYVFKVLIGMEHTSGARRVDPGPGVLKEHQWPQPTESGFVEVDTGDGNKATYHRPTWRNSRAAKTFFDAVSSTIELSYNDEWKKFGAQDVNAAIKKYYNSVSSSVRAQTNEEAGEAKRRKDRTNRRQQRVLRVLDARTKHFASSPLALCRESEFLRQSVLLPEVVPEQLSEDEEEIMRKSETMDERAVLRSRAVGKASSVGELHHRKERFWLSKLVRHASAVLDAHAASANRVASTSASARGSTSLPRASTFPIPRSLWSDGNSALPTIPARSQDGFMAEGAVGSPIPRSCVSSAVKAKNPGFAASLYADVLPVADETSRPRFYDLIAQPEWMGLMETVQRQLRTPRLLLDSEVVEKTESLQQGGIVDWSDEDDVDTDAEELANGQVDEEDLQNLLTAMAAGGT